MAEALARKLIAEKLGCQPKELEHKGVLITSAGIAAVPGCSPAEEAVSVMREKGLDISRHESQPLTDKLARHADLIFTMTSSHRLAIVRRWPEAASRTFPLRTDEGDIHDPIGGTIGVYRECGRTGKGPAKTHRRTGFLLDRGGGSCGGTLVPARYILDSGTREQRESELKYENCDWQ